MGLFLYTFFDTSWTKIFKITYFNHKFNFIILLNLHTHSIYIIVKSPYHNIKTKIFFTYLLTTQTIQSIIRIFLRGHTCSLCINTARSKNVFIF